MILIGNSFPLALLRRPVTITPRTPADLRAALVGEEVASYWGHESTMAAASALVGRDLRPATRRPALELDAEGLPGLNGRSFTECWVLAAQLPPGFRPAEGEILNAGQIPSWQVLHFHWSPRISATGPDA